MSMRYYDQIEMAIAQEICVGFARVFKLNLCVLWILYHIYTYLHI